MFRKFDPKSRITEDDATEELKLSEAVPEIGLYIPAGLRHAGRDFGCPFWVLFWASKKVQNKNLKEFRVN